MKGFLSSYGRMKKCIHNINGKIFGKSALRRSGYNTETDSRKIDCEDVSWPEVGLSKDRVLFRTLT
jgi:hypothetical protein